jgi:hypothetical protein
MTFDEVKVELQTLGLKETAAINWARYLTEMREPNLEEVRTFAETAIPAVKKRLAEQRARRPAELLTTPEETFND